MSWFYIPFVIYSQCKHIHIKTIYGLSLSCKITLLLQDTIKAPQCTVFSKIEVFFHFVILSFLISREMCEQSQNSFIAVVSDRFILTLDFIYYSDLLPQSLYQKQNVKSFIFITKYTTNVIVKMYYILRSCYQQSRRVLSFDGNMRVNILRVYMLGSILDFL